MCYIIIEIIMAYNIVVFHFVSFMIYCKLRWCYMKLGLANVSDSIACIVFVKIFKQMNRDRVYGEAKFLYEQGSHNYGWPLERQDYVQRLEATLLNTWGLKYRSYGKEKRLHFVMDERVRTRSFSHFFSFRSCNVIVIKTGIFWYLHLITYVTFLIIAVLVF